MVGYLINYGPGGVRITENKDGKDFFFGCKSLLV